jgi:hypothetical protein
MISSCAFMGCRCKWYSGRELSISDSQTGWRGAILSRMNWNLGGVATRGALPRFLLRQAYGATGSEAVGEQG